MADDSKSGQDNLIDLNKILMESSVAACRKQMLAFAKTMRDLFLKKGVSTGLINDAIRQAFDQYKELKEIGPEQFASVDKALYLYGQPHGLITDPVGMLLTEFALRRSKPQLLHPHDSPREKQAQETFTKGAIPWPIVRYLLIGVRGSIDYRDPFDSSPLFFGPMNERMNTLRQRADALVKEHTVSFTDGRRSVDWDTLYASPAGVALASELISFVLEGMEVLGPSRLQNILENLRNKDMQSRNSQALTRVVTEQDAAQIIDGFKSAHKILASEGAGKTKAKRGRDHA